jgi:hypothetical protein
VSGLKEAHVQDVAVALEREFEGVISAMLAA